MVKRVASLPSMALEQPSSPWLAVSFQSLRLGNDCGRDARRSVIDQGRARFLREARRVATSLGLTKPARLPKFVRR